MSTLTEVLAAHLAASVITDLAPRASESAGPVITDIVTAFGGVRVTLPQPLELTPERIAALSASRAVAGYHVRMVP